MRITLPTTTMHIGAQLSKQYAKEMEINMLMKISFCIKFLGRQGLALRGDGDESDRNFLQWFTLLGEDDGMVYDWLKRKRTYISHEIQNELLKIMALHVLRRIADHLQKSPFLTIMIDETVDVSNQEQVTIIMRSVDDDLEVYKDFLGLYQVTSIGAESLVAVIKDTMTKLNLFMSKICGQCYDGCSTMSGARSGVAKRIMVKNQELRIFTHCYGHSLNLAASDTVKNMKNGLDTTHEITKLVKFSPQHEAIFKDLKAKSDATLKSCAAGIEFCVLLVEQSGLTHFLAL